MNRFSSLFCSALLALGIASCQKEASKKDAPKGKAADGTGAARTKTPTNTPAAKADIPAPADVAAAPADAQKTANGVSYKVLTAATAPGDKPEAADTVEVHYTGWTTDGKMFDSSVKRGRPATFGLGQVIPGWTEGLQVMTVGEKTRFWIPEEMAYKGRKGAPAGMLVFDVELLSVKKAPKAPEDVAAPPLEALKTKEGVSYRIVKSGEEGAKSPRAWDRVKVHYTGWATDGKMLDTTSTRPRPAEFALGGRGVLDGWNSALQEMKVGDTWVMWIPQALAHKGEKNRPAGMLVYKFELLEVTEMPEPPAVPKDVAKAPRNAKKTESGVAYKMLSTGAGGPKPKPSDKVEVHYSGWTTDGKMFDSSVSRGRTATFPLTAVIKGWTDGLQVMSVGDKTRFWIPEDLAYKGRPGKPAGMLVFDVELVSIKEASPPPKKMPPKTMPGTAPGTKTPEAPGAKKAAETKTSADLKAKPALQVKPVEKK